jgi:hypothetical protein
MRVFEQRWRWWALLALAVVSLAVCSSLLWTGTGLTESRARKIVSGMSREEVEVVLGQPNHLPEINRLDRAFWDTYTLLGCHYVSITVYYNAEGKVDKALVTTFWKKPWELYWH